MKEITPPRTSRRGEFALSFVSLAMPLGFVDILPTHKGLVRMYMGDSQILVAVDFLGKQKKNGAKTAMIYGELRLKRNSLINIQGDY